jgi:hypothetical protein
MTANQHRHKHLFLIFDFCLLIFDFLVFSPATPRLSPAFNLLG